MLKVERAEAIKGPIKRTSKPITVTLGPMQAGLEKRLQSGDYDNASEILRSALRALDP